MGLSRKIRSIAAGRERLDHSAPVRLAEAARAADWWEYKLVPIFAVFYATALAVGAPLHGLWWAALTLFAALVPGAVYVSLINDLTDRALDAAVGKRNRTAGMSAATLALLLSATVAAGLFFAWTWRSEPLLLWSYLGAWAAFSLYSLPPFRLKVRGAGGVLADAAGALFFPALVAAAIVARASGGDVAESWLLAVGLWALCYGLRGILWHQLVDEEADRATGVRTFVLRSGRARALALARWIIFPLELCGLAALLWQLPSWLPLLFLLPYFEFTRRKLWVFRMVPVLVDPRPRYLIVLHDYYYVFLPLALLLACALRWPADVVALAAHLLLFPRRIGEVARDAWRLRPF